MIDDVLAKYNVDKSRVYLTGLSMGGFGAWELAMTFPDYFAAVAPICGGGNPLLASRLKNTPVWVFHGKKDESVPEQQSAIMERRMQAYYETIGRGSGLIVNLTPDRRGIIPNDLVTAAKEMGDEINRRFSNPVAQSELKDKEQIIKLNGTKTIDHVVLMEDLIQGQKISDYTIEVQVDGNWKTIVEGKTIGHKRIEQFKPVTATAIRFRVTGSVGENAAMRKIAVFTASI